MRSAVEFLLMGLDGIFPNDSYLYTNSWESFYSVGPNNFFPTISRALLFSENLAGALPKMSANVEFTCKYDITLL
jgi:isocitrate dehydrogenase kinase/phosphatase